MNLGRRAALRGLAALLLSALGLPRLRSAGASTAATPLASLAVHTLAAARSSDAADLRAIMLSCGASEASFYGKCGDWPLSWAESLIATRPDTPVLTKDGVAIAFHEVPPMREPADGLAGDATAAERAKYALRERSRRTFRVTAAGVRDDLLSPEESVAAFRQIIYLAYRRAHALGTSTPSASLRGRSTLAWRGSSPTIQAWSWSRRWPPARTEVRACTGCGGDSRTPSRRSRPILGSSSR
jgi:hypothetical protein